MRYRSKPAEVEAMQWRAHPGACADCVEEIVAWVNANGGEARYEPEHIVRVYFDGPVTEPRIAVRTINGWAYAAPGHYVVMGDATFEAGSPDPSDREPLHKLRDFYPCDPETFEKRWEPIS